MWWRLLWKCGILYSRCWELLTPLRHCQYFRTSLTHDWFLQRSFCFSFTSCSYSNDSNFETWQSHGFWESKSARFVNTEKHHQRILVANCCDIRLSTQKRLGEGGCRSQNAGSTLPEGRNCKNDELAGPQFCIAITHEETVTSAVNADESRKMAAWGYRIEFVGDATGPANKISGYCKTQTLTVSRKYPGPQNPFSLLNSFHLCLPINPHNKINRWNVTRFDLLQSVNLRVFLS